MSKTAFTLTIAAKNAHDSVRQVWGFNPATRVHGESKKNNRRRTDKVALKKAVRNGDY